MAWFKELVIWSCKILFSSFGSAIMPHLPKKLLIMAKILTTAIVDGISGKLRGSVFAKNRSGAYIRGKGSVSNPQTSYQQAVRGLFASFAASFRSLTEEQQNAWNGAVEAWKKTDIFGNSYKPTGLNLYVLVNINLNSAGTAPIDVPAMPVEMPLVGDLGLSVNVSDEEFIVSFSGSPVPSGFVFEVKSTPAFSPGVRYVKNKFRQVAVLPNGATSPQNIYSSQIARHGSLVAGMRYAITVTPISRATGQKGTPVTVQAIASA